MQGNAVREWNEAYERSRRRREEYRARLELDRLGLITRDDDEDAAERALSPRWRDEPYAPGMEDWAVSKPVGAGTRLALLAGVALIASLAVFFG